VAKARGVCQIMKWIIPLREERRAMVVPIVSTPASIETGHDFFT
jgi:hypothetical protein